ncbi:CHAD domain-containing protein [Salipiger mucosus]|uniref:CHAD domain-containing protein n=1 Tax=Salipiger mucosus DSM 16094 TaxID=1123237 RepID=S9S989_9RHOB|nr:CHAD domain-containing protein [Salipiger mucosus]EPX86725.1 hypothetical protein Salmuc_01202 [Salipiger mucosus DSM 16094]
MAYRIKPHDKSLTAALHRIAAEQIDRAIASTTCDPADAEEAVHDVRKRCKKLRGLFRLVRPGFDDYAAENAAARGIAGMASGLRDSDVLIETHDTVVDAADVAPGRFAEIRGHLVRSANRHAPGDAVGEALGRQRAALEEMRGRAATWRVTGKPAKVLAAGVGKTWMRGADAMQHTRENPTAETFHEWRKRVKYHWYHARLLEGTWPGPMLAHRTEAKRLSELLGDHHDIAVYLAWLEALDLPDVDGEAPAELRRLAGHRQEQLAHRAWSLGGRFFAPPVKALPKQWKAYWTSAGFQAA